MDLDLKGKRALVLASSQGLGRGVAEALAREGADVCISGRSGNTLASVRAEIAEIGPGKVCYVECDLNDADAASRLHKGAVEQLGGVDILVNNTGGPPPGPVSGPSAEVWQKQFNAMVLPVMELTALCLPAMKENGWGRVLTLASSGILQPIPNLGMSNTLRSALVGWSKTLSNEVAGSGITVNMLLPGRIHTERVDQLDAAAAERTGKTIDEVRIASRATIPAGRYGRVEEFASVAAFLVSGPASYVTGSAVRCDGGAIKSV